MAKAKKISEDYYGKFEKYKAEYFERKKSEYLFAVQIATIKNAGHNVFERKEMKPESDRLQKELGLHASLIIDIEHEMELDSRIVMKDRFNQKISEISIDKREAVIKGIGEYEGLRELYTFWQHKKDYVKIIDDPFSHSIETLIYLERDFAESFETMNTERKRIFTESLEMRATDEEKNTFALNEIKIQRSLIEDDLLNKFFSFLNQHPENFGRLIWLNRENYHVALSVLFGDKVEEGENLMQILMEHAFREGEDLDKEEISLVIKSLKEKGIESKALFNLLHGRYKEFEQRLFYITFYFHYEKLYLNFLIETYKELTQPKEIANIRDPANLEKFEWLGSQRKLGELFIELERKGWIKEINPALITQYFTKANTIYEVLKPGKLNEAGLPNFEKIFSKRYNPAFGEIKQNTGKTIDE